jgi:hypothetical protein
MDHQDWDFAADDTGGDPETTETADLGGYDDAGLTGGLDHGLESGLGEFNDDPAGAQPGGFDAQALDGLDEPLGTEDAAANYDAAIGEADQPGEPADTGAEQGLNSATDSADGPADTLIGADPDVDPTADDDGWNTDTFPPQLGLGETPEPVDGFPWSDPASLGGNGGDPTGGADPDTTNPDAADLAGYDNTDVPDGTDPWQVLVGSDDPATSSLARWWAPGG